MCMFQGVFNILSDGGKGGKNPTQDTLYMYKHYKDAQFLFYSQLLLLYWNLLLKTQLSLSGLGQIEDLRSEKRF